MAREQIIFDESINKLEKALKEVTRHQAIISHNIANLGTADFSPLSFDEELKSAKKKAANLPKEKEVVLEKEMAKLAQNASKQAALTRLLVTKFSLLRRVVTQGRG